VLKDAEKRRSYDQLRAGGYRQGEQFRPPPGWQGQSQGFGDGGDGDFSDFFESLFGRGAAGGHRGQPRPRRGQDVQASVRIDLQTAFDGGRTRLAMHDPAGGERVLEVKIPAGIQPGQVIRLSGQGQSGMAGGPNGDLLLEVGIHDDARFRLDGRNVVHVLPIAPWEAALGASVPVPTLAGTVDLRIPAGSQSGRKLRLKGRGMPGTHPGDQLVELSIRTPVADNDEQRAAYAALHEHFKGYNPRQ
jgi:curved DNA-binding protein